MTEKDVKSLLETFERSEEWFSANYEKLREKYEDKFLAIKDEKDIAANERIEALLKELKAKGEDIDRIFITSFPPKGVASIL